VGLRSPSDESREFVAAFALTNGGDVTPNLNLDTTGPGGGEFESTRIIAERQFDAALSLFESAGESVCGEIDFRHGVGVCCAH